MYIVISRTKEGVLRASTTPYKHDTLLSAKIECARMSKRFPGVTFFPMKALKPYKVEQKYAAVFN